MGHQSWSLTEVGSGRYWFAMAEPEKPADAAGTPYRFECQMSYLHRYIPADGTWLGLNGFNKIVLNFFNDSPPLPSQIITETRPGSLKFVDKLPELKFWTDAGTVRRYEVSVVLSVDAARRLQETLVKFIDMAENSKPGQESK
jgi:hypothetical protein